MKNRIAALVISTLLVLTLVSCTVQPATTTQPITATAAPSPTVQPTPEPTPIAEYKGEFRDMTAEELVAELEPGYTCDTLVHFDFMTGYDPYLTIPVNFHFGLGILDNSEYRYDWSTRLTLNETVPVAYDLKSLPDTPKDTRYDHFDLDGAVRAWQDIPMTIKVENARIELPDRTIDWSLLDGVYDATARDSQRFDKTCSYLNANLTNGDLPEPLDTETLQQGGVFKADITLISAEGPSKADYYSDGGILERIPAPTSEWFAFLKSEGFNSIRFQVTWFNHTNDETYEIDEAWLVKVEETVKLALENDFYCSINMNCDMSSHFNFYTGGLTKEEIGAIPIDHAWLTLDGDPKVEERFASVWKQIAEHFKDYDEHLIFESINEPEITDKMVEPLGLVSDSHGEWSDLGEAGENLNRLNQIFVDSVRSTGGNNTKRFLFVPPYFNRGIYLSEFQIPKDPAQHMIISMNYYMEDRDPFPDINQFFIDNGISAVFTEFGSSADEYPYEERLSFAQQAVAQANESGIPIIWYACGWGEEVQNSPGFCLYNPYTYERAFPELIDLLVNKD